MKKIVPNLWFNDQAEAAAHFYTSVFPNSKIHHTANYTDAGKEQHGHKAGEVMLVEFELEGLRFMGINGGPAFTINPSISFAVRCKDAEEVNSLWEKLSEGDSNVRMELDSYPFSERYGWLSDKFGVDWQISIAKEEVTEKIVPMLMFTQTQCGKAEEAMNFYASVFPQSDVNIKMRYTADQAPDEEGTVAYADFSLLGQHFAAMDSAHPHDFVFNEGISLLVECQDQTEIDTYWEKLSAVPEAEMCGWLKDKYGVSWQIAPVAMNEMQQKGTPEQLERVTAAYMQMKKFDLAKLERAYRGE